jgi:phospholipase C
MLVSLVGVCSPSWSRFLKRSLAATVLGFCILSAPGQADSPLGSLWTNVTQPSTYGRLSKLKHLIFIIQENRSFDHYFGTYPGADGFPSPLPCLPSSWYPNKCFTPYENHNVIQQGGPYANPYQVADIDGGKMDGFVIEREKELEVEGCKPPAGVRRHSARQLDYLQSVDDNEGIPRRYDESTCISDVMGYHDGTDLPNYWAYAKNFVLFDHFFESVHSQSHPSHLESFSGWTAFCKQLSPPDVQSCVSSPDPNHVWGAEYPTPYLWTDITYLLWKHGVTWGVYLDGGLGPIEDHCCVLPIWDVLPGFEDVQDDGQVGNALINLKQFYSDASAGTLPQVTWILPKYFDSEHPQAHIDDGQAYVTGLVNAVMQGPEWDSSAIFLSHDDMGGFYDHARPPLTFDSLGLGIRVPAMLISPYAIEGYIEHQVCSTDCYIKFIEDVFIGGARLKSAGRPDPRPDYRDQVPGYGDLADDSILLRRRASR